MGEAQD